MPNAGAEGLVAKISPKMLPMKIPNFWEKAKYHIGSIFWNVFHIQLANFGYASLYNLRSNLSDPWLISTEVFSVEQSKNTHPLVN